MNKFQLIILIIICLISVIGVVVANYFLDEPELMEEEMTEEEFEGLLELYPNETEEINEEIFEEVVTELEEELFNPQFEEITELPEIEENIEVPTERYYPREINERNLRW